MAIPNSKDDREWQKFTESSVVANKVCVSVVNPDGSNIAGGAGGGGDGAVLDGANPLIKASVFDYASSNPLAVRLTDVSGDYVGAGAGTQYADGGAVAVPTGTVSLGFDGANVRAVKTDAAGDVQVDVLSSALPTGAATELSLGNVKLNTDRIPSLGQTTMAGSSPVVLANNHSTIPVSVGSLPLPLDASTETTLALLNGKVTVCNTGAVAGTVTANLGTIGAASTESTLAALEFKAATETTLAALNGKVTACNTGAVVVSTLPDVNQATASNLNAQIVGNIAHDGVDSGNPVKVGGVAKTSDQTAVADADRVNIVCDKVGKQVVMPYTLPENILSGTASATDDANTSIIAAQGAGVRVYVTSIIIANSSDNNDIVNIKDGATTKLVFPVPAYGGAVHNLSVPLMLTANTALQFAAGTGADTIYVSAVGYKGV